MRRAAWRFARPSPGFEAIAESIAFYPALMDECSVDGERAQAQPGDFYGGWVTSEITGPFKGARGTAWW